MTRILHLHPTFCVGSGIDEVVRNLMKQTSTLGFESELACFRADNVMIDDVKPSQVILCKRTKPVVILDNTFGLFPALFGKILANKMPSISSSYHIIKEHIDGADIVHAHFYPFTAFSSFNKPKNKKLVIHNYGIPNNMTGLTTPEKFKLLVAKRSEHLFSNADVVISISDFLKTDLYEHTGLDSVVVPPGIDIKHFQYSAEGRNAVRSKYNIPENAFVIFFVGRLTPYKKVDLLIDAFCLVKKQVKNAKLMIAPSPRCYKTPFEIQVKKLGLQKDVIFAQDVSFENMPDYYSACDIHTSCSIWEGFGLPFIEAAACGKPSIGFAGIPGLEVLSRDSGLRVEQKCAEAFAEKIVAAASMTWDSQKLRSQSADFSWDIMAKRVVDVYSTLL